MVSWRAWFLDREDPVKSMCYTALGMLAGGEGTGGADINEARMVFAWFDSAHGHKPLPPAILAGTTYTDDLGARGVGTP